MEKRIQISKRYFKSLKTRLRHAKGELAVQKGLVDFVKAFNPRLFYRNPKVLIQILCDYKKLITGKSLCTK